MHQSLYNYLQIPEGVEIINTRTDHCHEIKIGKHRFVDLKKEVENDELK